MKVTFSVACLLGLASAETHYGNPANGCEDDEQAVKVTGISGAFCSPDCSSGSCPTDVPSGVTAEPQCALKMSSGGKACALICSASTDEASLRAGDAQCGEATCQPIQGAGICTYDAMGTSPSQFAVFTAAKKVGDEAKCIADIEALIPGVEKAIADLKAGKQTAFQLDMLLLLPKAEAAYKECTASGKKNPKMHHVMKKFKYMVKNGKPEDLPTCIADLEAMIPAVEKIIADFKAGDYPSCLTDALTLLPEAEKAYTDCTASKPFHNGKDHHKIHKVQDLPTCIADLEAMLPGVEKIIADFKAGNYDTALTDALALLPDAEKAFTDCTASATPKVMRKLHHFKKFASKINVGDLPTCIADLEAMIPAAEQLISDFKAGDYNKCLTDALTLLPEAEKAYTDCTASAKAVGGRFKTILKDDPKREYFEKMGAEFATGFLAGTKVGRFDSIDLYECLHREPTAVEIFYKADEEFKLALVKKDTHDAIKAIDEMIYFIIELVKEDYPHTHVQVCSDFKSEDAQWGDLELILKELKDPSTTLMENSDRHIFFNKMDITSASHSIVEDYLKSDFGRLGYNLGDLMQKESKPASEGLFLY